jgi:glycosyltransferase involved in cell wall biosynthesis
MRIAFVIYGRLDTLTGGYLYDGLLVDSLRRAGHEVRLIRLPRGSPLRCLGHNLQPQLRRRILDIQPDLILEDGLCMASLAFCNPALRRLARAPVAVLAHQVASARNRRSPQRIARRLLEKRFFSSADVLVCTSSATLEEIRTGLRVHNKPALAVRPGWDRLGMAREEEVRGRCRQSGPLRLLFLANVLANKGLGCLLRVLQGWERSDWELTVAGDLEMEPRYARRMRLAIERSDLLRQRVRLCGVLTGENLAACIRTHHVLALPFSVEGFGMVFPEGMAFGLPALASQLGGAREIVVHGENGFLTDPSAPQSLLGHLRRLRDEPGLLESMSLAALRTARAWPTWGESMEEARRFLESTADHPPGAPVPFSPGTPAGDADPDSP